MRYEWGKSKEPNVGALPPLMTHGIVLLRLEPWFNHYVHRAFARSSSIRSVMLVLLHSEGNMKIIAQEVLRWLARELELVVQLGHLFHGHCLIVG